MLIRPGGVGIPHRDPLPGLSRTHTVRDDPVVGEVSAADDIPRPGGGDGHLCIPEEAAEVTVGHQLRAGFGVGVGVIAVQGLVLPVAPDPFSVLIDFVGGDIHHRPHRYLCEPDTLQDVHRAHHIGLVGVDRVLVAVPDNGLGCQMENNLRSGGVEGSLQLVPVPDIAGDGGHLSLQSRKLKKVRLSRGRQSVASDDGAGAHQHPAEPAALETSVTSDEDPFAAVKLQYILHQSAHTFQGACPAAHSFSRVSFSRTVSMHCQKPLCL